MTTVKTIGELRTFLAQFPAEADDYPFAVAAEGCDPFGSVEVSVVPNVDGHPDYAMLVTPLLVSDECPFDCDSCR